MLIGEWLQNELMPKAVKYKNRLFILGVAIIILDVVVWSQIAIFAFASQDLKINFLDVGQGDSEFMILPGGARILIDGGPANSKLIEQLSKIFSPTNRYIDLVFLSHAQLDHFGGLIEVLKRYKVGAFLWNGREGEAPAFFDLMNLVKTLDIPNIILAQNDKIHYGASDLNVLLPDNQTLQSKDLNDTALVLEMQSNNSKTLFTGDISSKLETDLIRFFHGPIDVLKVAHHGSKFSSSVEFLNVLKPRLAFIEVGKNSYGHPTPDVLSRLKEIGASIFRTDQSGNIELVINGQGIKVFAENKL